ncbi:hypothetical protein RCL1_003796 [Eukaryota sp. TZLM3-RCL]
MRYGTKVFDYSRRGLSKLDKSTLSTLSSAEVVILSDNQFLTIPPELSKLQSIQELRFCGNPIQSLQQVSVLSHCRSLHTVSFARTPISQLPQYRLYVIYTIPTLYHLDSQPVLETERKEAKERFDVAEKKALREQISEHRLINDQLKETNSSLTTRISQLENQMKKLHSSTTSVVDERNSLVEKLRELEILLRSRSQELTRANVRIAELEQQLATISDDGGFSPSPSPLQYRSRSSSIGEASNLKQTLEVSHKQEISHLKTVHQEVVMNLQHQLSLKQEELDHTRNEIASTKSQLETVINDKRSLDAENSEQEVLISNLQAQIVEQDSIISNLKSQLDNVPDVSHYEDLLLSHEEEKQKLSRELSDTHNKINQLHREIEHKDLVIVELKTHRIEPISISEQTQPSFVSNLTSDPKLLLDKLKDIAMKNEDALEQLRNQMDDLYLTVNDNNELDSKLAELNAKASKLTSLSKCVTDLMAEVRSEGQIPSRLVAELSLLSSVASVPQSNLDVNHYEQALLELDEERNNLRNQLQQLEALVNELQSSIQSKDAEFEFQLQTSTEAKNSQISSLQSQLTLLNSKVSELDSQLQSEQLELRNATESINNLTARRDELENQVESINTTVLALRNEKSEKESELDRLRQLLEQSESELRTSLAIRDGDSSQLDSLQKIIEEKDSAISGLELQISNLNTDISKREGEISELNIQCNKFNEQISDLVTQIKSLEEVVKEKEIQEQTMSQSLAEIRTKNEQVTLQLRNQLSTKQSELASLQSLLEQTQSELEAVLLKRDVEIQEIVSDLRSKEDQLVVLQAQLAEKETLLSQLEVKKLSETEPVSPLVCSSPKLLLDKLKDIAMKNEDALEQLRNQMDDLYLTVNDNNELDSKLAELNAKASKLTSLSKCVTDLMAEVRSEGQIPSRLVAELSLLSSVASVPQSNLDVNHYEQALLELDEERNNLRNQLQQLEALVNDLQSSIQSKDAEFEQLSRDHVDVSKTLVDLGNAKENLESQLQTCTEAKNSQISSLQSQLNLLNSKVSELESQLQSGQLELRNATESINTLTAQRDELENQVESINATVLALRNEKSEKESELDRLRQLLEQSESELRTSLAIRDGDSSQLKAQLAEKETLLSQLEVKQLSETEPVSPLVCSSPKLLLDKLKDIALKNEDALEQLRNQMDDLYLTVNDNNELDSKLAELNAKASKLTSLSKCVTDLMAEVRSEGQIPSRLVAELSLLSSVASVPQSNLDVNHYEQALLELDEERNNLRNQLQQLEALVNDLQSSIQSKEAEFEQLSRDHVDVSKTLVDLGNAKENLESQLQTSTEAKNSQISSLQSQLNLLNSKVSELESQLQSEQLELRNATESINNLTAQRDELENQVESINTTVLALRNEKSEKESELDRLRQLLEQSESELRTSIAIRDGDSSQLDSLQKIIEEKDSAISGLELQISNVNTDISKREGEISELNIQCNKFNEQISDLVTQIKSLEEVVKEKEIQEQTMSQSLAEIRTKNEQVTLQLRKQLSTKQSELASLQSLLQQTQSELEAVLLKRDVEIQEIVSDLRSKEDQLVVLQAQLADKETIISNLNDQLVTTCDASHYEEQLLSLEQEKNKLLHELSETHANLRQLQKDLIQRDSIISEKEQSSRTLSETLSSVRSSSESTITSLKNQLLVVRGELSSLQDTLEQSKNEQQSVFDHSRSETRRLSEELSELTLKHDHLLSSHSELEAALEKERSRNHALRDRISTLSATKESLSATNDDNLAEQKKLRFEVVRLTTSISQLYAKVMELERSNSSLSALLTQERENSEDLSARVVALSDSKQRLLDFCQECTALAEQKSMALEDVRSELVSEKEKCLEFKKQASKISTKYRDLESEYHSAFIRLESLTSHEKILNKQVTDLKAKLSALEAIRGESEATIEILRRRLLAAKEEIDHRDEKILDLSNQLSELRISLKTASSQLSDHSGGSDKSTPLLKELRAAREQISQLDTVATSSFRSPYAAERRTPHSHRAPLASPSVFGYTPTSSGDDVEQLRSKVRELQRTNFSLEKSLKSTPTLSLETPASRVPSFVLPRPSPIPLADDHVSPSRKRNGTVFYDIVNRLKDDKMKELESFGKL